MDAMALLAAGKVDVVSNAVHLTHFNRSLGCRPYNLRRTHGRRLYAVIAKAGTEWNGIESFIGESVAVNPSYFAFTGAVMDLGYDNPSGCSRLESILKL